MSLESGVSKDTSALELVAVAVTVASVTVLSTPTS